MPSLPPVLPKFKKLMLRGWSGVRQTILLLYLSQRRGCAKILSWFVESEAEVERLVIAIDSAGVVAGCLSPHGRRRIMVPFRRRMFNRVRPEAIIEALGKALTLDDIAFVDINIVESLSFEIGWLRLGGGEEAEPFGRPTALLRHPLEENSEEVYLLPRAGMSVDDIMDGSLQEGEDVVLVQTNRDEYLVAYSNGTEAVLLSGPEDIRTYFPINAETLEAWKRELAN
jgi:hypothetical protein